MGVQAEGRLYGVETRESCEGLWGIRFSSALYEKLLGHMQARRVVKPGAQGYVLE